MSYPKDLLTLQELTPKQLGNLIDFSIEVKKKPKKFAKACQGRTLAMIFHKNSTRTRISFEVGMTQMGGHAIFLGGNDIQLSRGETPYDTAQVLSRYVDAIMIRTFSHDLVETLAKNATVPVINGLTDDHHPCQIIADFQTIKEKFGKISGLNIVYLGDGNNVVHSLMIASALLGANFKCVCPKNYLPSKEVTAWARKTASKNGSKIEVVHEVKNSVNGAHVIYTDAWASMGQEAQAEKRRKDFKGYTVNASLMKQAPKAIFMHCLPAHRGEEVTDQVMDGPQSVVFDQAENRLHAQKALIIELLGRKKK